MQRCLYKRKQHAHCTQVLDTVGRRLARIQEDDEDANIDVAAVCRWLMKRYRTGELKTRILDVAEVKEMLDQAPARQSENHKQGAVGAAGGAEAGSAAPTTVQQSPWAGKKRKRKKPGRPGASVGIPRKTKPPRRRSSSNSTSNSSSHRRIHRSMS